MNTFEPLINLIVLLTALSIVAERVTNVLKLRRPKLKARLDGQDNPEREAAIALSALGIGVLVALLVKADLFAILKQLDNPWATLGWLQVDKYTWTRTPATATLGNAAHCIAGCVLTGCALGFGSKFWHDTLGAVYEVRNMARNRNAIALTTGANKSRGSGS